VVPRIVYVELEDGTPVLIREWGEPLQQITPREFAALEAELLDVERQHSWRVNDDLQLYRRADGSVFVGDVGFWSVRQDPKWSAADSSLDMYGERVLKAHGTPEMQGMPLLVDILKTSWALKFSTGNLGIWINGVLRPKANDKPEQMLKWATGDSRRVTESMEGVVESLDARRALGATTPPAIEQEALAAVRLAQNALEGYRRLVEKMARG
jgi:hypothetical protein